MTNINYYPEHRSGCTLKRDSLIDSNRMYVSSFARGAEEIKLICDFKRMPDLISNFILFTIDHEIDYNSFNSLN